MAGKTINELVRSNMIQEYKIYLNGERIKNAVAALAGNNGYVIIETMQNERYEKQRLPGKVQIYYYCDCGSISECGAVNLK